MKTKPDAYLIRLAKCLYNVFIWLQVGNFARVYFMLVTFNPSQAGTLFNALSFAQIAKFQNINFATIQTFNASSVQSSTIEWLISDAAFDTLVTTQT
jgi:hypothetical protein